MISETILIIKKFFYNPYAIPHFIVAHLFLLLGLFVLIQHRKSLTNISYFFVCISGYLWLILDALAMSSPNEKLALFLAKYVYVGITLIPPSMYFFAVAWLKQIDKKRKWVIFYYCLGLIFILLFLTTDIFIEGVERHFFGYFSRLRAVSIVYLLYFFSVSADFFLNLLRSYRNEKDSFEKIRIRRVLIAFIAAFLGATEFLPTYGITIYPIGSLSVFLFTVIVAHTIIRYKLMDIETVIHKSIGWFLTNLVLVTPFVALVYITRSWYIHFEGMGTFIFLGGVLLAFLFFVRVFHPKIDHFFQRRRFGLEETASKFIEDVVHLKGINKLVEHIEEVIKETLYSHSVDIFIYDENKRVYRLANFKDNTQKVLELESDNQFLQWLVENNKIVYKDFVVLDPRYTSIRDKAKDYFNLTQAIVVVPLILNDKLLGIINLGKKANLRRYNAFDIHFLRILKSQSAVAISNSLVYDNIEREVKQRTKELVEIQKQLIQAEKLATVGTLAGGVAHEINNPLTAILTNVQLLLASDAIRDASDVESLKLIEEATMRCRNIVQKLMAYARKPLKPSEVSKIDLLNVVKNVVSFLNYQLDQENIKIITKTKEDNYPVYGNHNEMEQVVTNLVLNAKDSIKRIKKGGNIYISLFKSGGWIKIEIKDEGAGIPKNMISKIFDPFFTTKEVGKGLGLGLSICQAIVERHNGLINVQSELNKGAVFTVSLPAVKIEYEEKKRVEPKFMHPSGAQKRDINIYKTKGAR